MARGVSLVGSNATVELGRRVAWALGQENEFRACTMTALLEGRDRISRKHSGEWQLLEWDKMDRELDPRTHDPLWCSLHQQIQPCPGCIELSERRWEMRGESI